MNSDFLVYIQEKLIDSFKSDSFLEKTHLKKNDIVPYIDNTAFIVELSILFEGTRLTCKNVLNLCKMVLINLFSDEPKEGWLQATYNYGLYKCFPHLKPSETLSSTREVSILVFLAFLKVLFYAPKKFLDLAPEKNHLDLDFLSGFEIDSLYNPYEYKKFVKSFGDNHVYEMIRLHQELTNHNTYDHICAVHYISLYIGRQLQNANIPIDLGIVSGAAAGHDIGKLACSSYEEEKTPYLHYYYTDLWFSHNNMPDIGHVAANHSIWDLELENLPLESLILIYADFRAKYQKENDKNKIEIYSLEDSFAITLHALEDADEDKISRYKKVYNKLVDFENYMKNLGIGVSTLSPKITPLENRNVILMNGKEVVEHLKYKAIEHNIYLMNKLHSETALTSMIEYARSKNSWNVLRSTLNILREYYIYFTQKQKLITLNYLYDLLAHHQKDVRKEAAKLMGTIIATYDEIYKEEVLSNKNIKPPSITGIKLFSKYFEAIIHPDHKIMAIYKERLGYNLRIMCHSLFVNSRPEQLSDYRNIIIDYLSNLLHEDLHVMLNLLQTIKFTPWDKDDKYTASVLYNILLGALKNESSNIRLMALDRIELLSTIYQDSDLNNKVIDFFNTFYNKPDSISENYLRCRIYKKLDPSSHSDNWFVEKFIDKNNDFSEVFLTNLKVATSWISKKYHIELMLEYAKHGNNSNTFYTAMHFCNLIKVSSKENVSINAGKALLKIMKYLSPEQRNDIAVELMRSLEVESFENGVYIPKYLGQVLLTLNPEELNEQISALYNKCKTASKQTVFLILHTIGITINYYFKYKDSFNESENIRQKRLESMLGILLISFSNYDDDIKQEAFTVTGNLFESKLFSLSDKQALFNIIAKKILVFLSNKNLKELLHTNSVHSLNPIYRFISDYIHAYGDIDITIPKRAAFFPGTFDPFSLSHKEIAAKVRDLGFEVFLVIYEFSWSKSTQPHIHRKQIIDMSIADEKDMYIFPSEIPINIANPKDIVTLSSIFSDREVYIAVGSDVILNTPSYRSIPTSESIHHCHHIIFKRLYSEEEKKLEELYKKIIKKMDNDIIELYLPAQLDMIRSSLIREYIDENRDISTLIDPLAQKYIYEYGLYLREPLLKPLIENYAISFKSYDSPSKKFLQTLCDLLLDNNKDTFDAIYNLIKNKDATIKVLYNSVDGLHISGFSITHTVSSSSLYAEFENDFISEHIRKNYIGRMVIIDGIFTTTHVPDNTCQIILSETLSQYVAEDYTYAIYRNIFKNKDTDLTYSTLENQGFLEISHENNQRIFDVNMSRPSILNLDVLTYIKEPFKSNPRVIKAIKGARLRLQKALTELFPGNLVISFEREALYQSLIEKITSTNDVPATPVTPRLLGPCVCAPFGQILQGYILPNTVTKCLHTEKTFNSDASEFFISNHPNYLNLDNQIKMIKSFSRPVILVDDILDKGFRIKALNPLLKKEAIDVKKIIVGILSSRGKELMDMQGRDVDCAYFIPNLKNWFTEASMYPFIGGDSVWTGTTPRKNLLPSINLVYPYVSPSFIKGASNESLINLSRVCIENSISILSVLEKEYQSINEKSLTLGNLGKVIISPRAIDRGKGIDYDYNQKTSSYLKNDLEHLSRLSGLIGDFNLNK